MGIFDGIMSAIFNHVTAAQGRAAAAPGAQARAAGASLGGSTAPSATAASHPAGSAGGLGAAIGTAAPAAATAQRVDVEAVLTEKAEHKKEHLNWRQSIVDLMKLLDLDSSLGARKELAQELGYKGELNGSAEMNIWLQKQVMQKLAANGGKVPAELTS